jgi:hypothetical protein
VSYQDQPDGVPDAYLLNPSWGAIYLVGNFNTTDFTAYVLEFVRRQFKGWQMEASYTWSKAVGDAEDYDLQVGDDRPTCPRARVPPTTESRGEGQRHHHHPRGFQPSVQWSGLPYSVTRDELAVDSMPPPTTPSASPPRLGRAWSTRPSSGTTSGTGRRGT